MLILLNKGIEDIKHSLFCRKRKKNYDKRLELASRALEKVTVERGHIIVVYIEKKRVVTRKELFPLMPLKINTNLEQQLLRKVR